MEAPPTMGSLALAAETPDLDPDVAIMERNGIIRVPAHQYWVDGYRYTNLADALAQVNRSARARAGTAGLSAPECSGR